MNLKGMKSPKEIMKPPAHEEGESSNPQDKGSTATWLVAGEATPDNAHLSSSTSLAMVVGDRNRKKKRKREKKFQTLMISGSGGPTT